MKRGVIIFFAIIMLIVVSFGIYLNNSSTGNVISETRLYTQEISTCGVLDSPNTLYVLKNNIDINSGCFVIAADNVTLDGNNHIIRYTPNQTINGLREGIKSLSTNNVIIKDIQFASTVSNPSEPVIRLESFNFGKVEGVTANGPLYLISSSQNIISLNRISVYFKIKDSSANIFSHNKLYMVIIENSNDDLFISNIIKPFDRNSASFSIFHSNNLSLKFNSISAPASETSAAYIGYSTNLQMISNDISCTYAGGMYYYDCLVIGYSSPIILINNNISSKSGGGHISSISNSILSSNRIKGSNFFGSYSGVFIKNVSNSIISSNEITGISLESANNNKIFKNNISYSGFGLEYPAKGISLTKSFENNISLNNIFYLSQDGNNSGGIVLYNSSRDIIDSNNIFINYGPAVSLSHTFDSLVLSNNLNSFYSSPFYFLITWVFYSTNPSGQGIGGVTSSGTLSMGNSVNNTFVNNKVLSHYGESLFSAMSSENLFQGNNFSSFNSSVRLLSSYNNTFTFNIFNSTKDIAVKIQNLSNPSAPKSINNLFVNNLVYEIVNIVCGDSVCGNEETCFSCPTDCGVCHYCGDGAVKDNEECDDRNILSGDGCSQNCLIEKDYICLGEPSVCEFVEPVSWIVNSSSSGGDSRGSKFNNSFAEIEFVQNMIIQEDKIDLILLHTSLSETRVSINSSILAEFKEIPAIITFKNINFINPQIHYNNSLCSPERCTFISYNKSSGEFIFNVTGFSEYQIVEEGYCGDGICNNGEDCSSCSGDCGSCPVTPSGSSGGGGGGGGYSRSNSVKCIPRWECTFGSCQNWVQTSVCVDLNNCNDTANKPEEGFVSCVEQFPDVSEGDSYTSSEEGSSQKDFSFYLTLGVILLIVFISGVVIWFVHKKSSNNRLNSI